MLGRLARWFSSAGLRGLNAVDGPGPGAGGRGGASSFHLWWRLVDDEPLVDVTAVCEVVEPPAVDQLYFWALQVGFSDGHRSFGGAHTGLQWHHRRSGGRAANWGGYHDASDGGAELKGSVSALPRLDTNGNTVRYDWEPGRSYALHVDRTGEGWRASVTDQETGDQTVLRHLYAPGPYLHGPVMWSEVFAGCDAPAVAVRWSGLWATSASGAEVRPTEVSVSYQAAARGGCPNTNVVTDHRGLVQVTNATREVADGSVLAVPA